jgi:hypothetical protein
MPTDLDAAEQRNREHGPLDLDRVLQGVLSAKGYVGELDCPKCGHDIDTDPHAWVAAALQDAADMAAELRAARETIRKQAIYLAEAHEVIDAARSAQATLDHAFKHYPEPAGGEPDAD